VQRRLAARRRRHPAPPAQRARRARAREAAPALERQPARRLLAKGAPRWRLATRPEAVPPAQPRHQAASTQKRRPGADARIRSVRAAAGASHAPRTRLSAQRRPLEQLSSLRVQAGVSLGRRNLGIGCRGSSGQARRAQRDGAARRGTQQAWQARRRGARARRARRRRHGKVKQRLHRHLARSTEATHAPWRA
jgi:hypothetical protein